MCAMASDAIPAKQQTEQKPSTKLHRKVTGEPMSLLPLPACYRHFQHFKVVKYYFLNERFPNLGFFLKTSSFTGIIVKY